MRPHRLFPAVEKKLKAASTDAPMGPIYDDLGNCTLYSEGTRDLSRKVGGVLV